MARVTAESLLKALNGSVGDGRCRLSGGRFYHVWKPWVWFARRYAFCKNEGNLGKLRMPRHRRLPGKGEAAQYKQNGYLLLTNLNRIIR